jgi:hypothetical protein
MIAHTFEETLVRDLFDKMNFYMAKQSEHSNKKKGFTTKLEII